MNIEDLTPVEYIDSMNVYVKRDDLFTVFGMHGGKSRAAYQIINQLKNKGYNDIVTAGSRHSPQCEIVSYICENLNLNCHVFMPFGEETSVIKNISKNSRTKIIRVKPAYNNVLSSKSLKYANENNFGYVPFGMECKENIDITCNQVLNIPNEVQRIVVPIGSGMTFCSIINGLLKHNINKPILGVQVGKDPKLVIKKYAPLSKFVDYTIIKSSVDYSISVNHSVGTISLDPIYEAKCFDYLKANDLLWIVGRRLEEV